MAFEIKFIFFRDVKPFQIFRHHKAWFQRETDRRWSKKLSSDGMSMCINPCTIVGVNMHNPEAVKNVQHT